MTAKAVDIEKFTKRDKTLLDLWRQSIEFQSMTITKNSDVLQSDVARNIAKSALAHLRLAEETLRVEIPF